MPLSSISKIVLGCKIFELLIACSCMGLHAHARMPNDEQTMLVSIVFGGYIIIISGMILGFIVGERIPRKIDLFYTLVGMALFLSTGSVMLRYFSQEQIYPKTYEIGVSGGALAIVNSLILVADALLTYKDVNEYIPH